eukprot:GHVQ01004726.1.p1 GENE.GHVQ01004726.1~~GHVQ01004726.1.p1  ORF type:complete len:584 (-),score=71.12 GHVQ01004726.1:1975-3726(-)
MQHSVAVACGLTWLLLWFHGKYSSLQPLCWASCQQYDRNRLPIPLEQRIRRLHPNSTADAYDVESHEHGTSDGASSLPRGQASKHGLVYEVLLSGGIYTHSYYFLDVHVGQPVPQRQSVILDTGSSLLAFSCSQCKGCGEHIDPPFDLAKSRSAEWLRCSKELGEFDCRCNQAEDMCEYRVEYEEGSLIAGQMFRDIVVLSGKWSRGEGAAVNGETVSVATVPVADQGSPDSTGEIVESREGSLRLRSEGGGLSSRVLLSNDDSWFSRRLTSPVVMAEMGCHNKETDQFVTQEATGIMGLSFASSPDEPRTVIDALFRHLFLSDTSRDHVSNDKAVNVTEHHEPTSLQRAPRSSLEIDRLRGSPDTGKKEQTDKRKEADVPVETKKQVEKGRNRFSRERGRVGRVSDDVRYRYDDMFAICLSIRGGLMTVGGFYMLNENPRSTERTHQSAWGEVGRVDDDNIVWESLLHHDFYALYLRDVYVGDELAMRDVGAEVSEGAMLDSGTTLTHVPYSLWFPLVAAIRKKLPCERDCVTEQLYRLCWRTDVDEEYLYRQLPTLTLTWRGGGSVSWAPENYAFTAEEDK